MTWFDVVDFKRRVTMRADCIMNTPPVSLVISCVTFSERSSMEPVFIFGLFRLNYAQNMRSKPEVTFLSCCHFPFTFIYRCDCPK